MKQRAYRFIHYLLKLAMSREEAAKILGVDPRDPPDVIKKVYKRKVIELHPDRVGAQSTDAMAQVNVAFSVLNEPQSGPSAPRQDAPGPAPTGPSTGPMEQQGFCSINLPFINADKVPPDQLRRLVMLFINLPSALSDISETHQRWKWWHSKTERNTQALASLPGAMNIFQGKNMDKVTPEQKKDICDYIKSYLKVAQDFLGGEFKGQRVPNPITMLMRYYLFLIHY